MSGKQQASRSWFIDLAADSAQLRCSFQRVGKQVQEFVVQLEIWHRENWRPIVRYDNAHGFCHRDNLHPDGSQDKSPLLLGDVNEVFTFAIEDLRSNWEIYRSRYLAEAQS